VLFEADALNPNRESLLELEAAAWAGFRRMESLSGSLSEKDFEHLEAVFDASWNHMTQMVTQGQRGVPGPEGERSMLALAVPLLYQLFAFSGVLKASKRDVAMMDGLAGVHPAVSKLLNAVLTRSAADLFIM